MGISRPWLALAVGFALVPLAAFGGDKRFGRPVVKVADPARYQYLEVDEAKIPVLAGKSFTVSCLVYRGSDRYYVEAGINNQSDHEVSLGPNLIVFDKPKYTVLRSDALEAANNLWGGAQERFVPIPPPPPTTTTTATGTATTYGNTTSVRGTATTTSQPDGGAALGNALGNMIARRRFANAQRADKALAQLLGTTSQEADSAPVPAGATRLVTATFVQLKSKKAPFVIRIVVEDEVFEFSYKE